MRRGLRYSPPSRQGRRRAGILGAGLLAVLSLVWQQQATLASYADGEVSAATFTAATLEAITPTTTAKISSIDISWDAADGDWATPQYDLDWSTSASASGATPVYAGSGTTATHSVGSAASTGTLKVTKVSTGGTQSCAVAQGRVFCWGTNSNGALGLGGTTSTNSPVAVGGALTGRTVTDVSVGTNHACAVAGGKAFCWGLATNGRLGNGTTSGTYTTPVAVSTGAMSGTVTSISAGDTHTCAIGSGKAYCWGTGTNGRLGTGSTTSSTSPAAVAVSGLLAGRTVTAVTAGTAHSCAVADGLAFCWGNGSNGRLGNSVTSGTYSSPVAVDTTTGLAGLTVTAVSAGNTHSCAVVDGAAYCWGQASNGRLGNAATSGNYSQPAAVNTSTMVAGSVTAINAGSAHSCAVGNGKAYCWGYNNVGQLGDNSVTQRTTPVAVYAAGVLSGRTVTALTAGASTSCSVADDRVSCWGLGTGGQLGNGSSSTSRVPVDASVTGLTCPAGAVLDGSDCSLVQGTDYYYRLDHSIGSWGAPKSDWVKETTTTRSAVSPSASSRAATSLTLGWDQVAKLGDSYAEYVLQRSTSASGSAPTSVYAGPDLTATDRGGIAARTGNLTVDAITAGTDHSCAVLEGAAYCWGNNDTGELGDLTTTSRGVATAVDTTGVLGERTVSAVSSGDNHTCAVADGGVYCWGENEDGELGNGTQTDSSTPVAAGSLAGATAVAAGSAHTCALADGSVFCWGDNNSGQLGDGGATKRSTTPVQVQGLLAGKTVTAIAAGGEHTCAVASGAAYCWGLGSDGQLGNGRKGGSGSSDVPEAVDASGVLAGLTVTAVAAGDEYTCVIAGGAAYCWGRNKSGQLGDGTSKDQTVSVAVVAPWATGAELTSLAAGMDSTCVVASGKAYCWGENNSGQLGNANTTDQETPVAVTATGVLSGTVDEIAVGEEHTCARSGGSAYCWGSNKSGRLGDGTTTNSTQPVAVTGVAAPPCSGGASLITPTTCSLKPNTTYYYRVKFTVDGAINTPGDWVAIKTTT